jgi:hypothetical protein
MLETEKAKRWEFIHVPYRPVYASFPKVSW